MSLHRRAAKRDDSEASIVDRLKALGAGVVRVSGENVPDLLIGWRGMTLLAEVKTGKAKLKPGQVEFASNWRGAPVATLRTPEQAQDWLLSQGNVVVRVATAEQLACAWHDAERESSAGFVYDVERVKG